ncbi:MAG: ABC transporter substrate-binding protein [Chloroflexi bacterium]|nr:ABC transporter substrate-binding protein [Chloroflexota bacterium]
MFGDASKIVLALPRMRRRPVLGVGAGLAGAAALGLAACGAGEQSSAPAGQAGQSSARDTSRPAQAASLRLSWIKNVEFAGFFVALDKGYYRDEGINLTISGSAQNLNEVQAVSTKADLIGLSGSTTLLKARAQGIPTKAFGALFQKGPGCFIWLGKSGITGIKDFKGKKLGGLQTSRPSVEAILIMNGLKAEDLSFVPIGFDVSPLLTGQVDILAGIVTNQVVVLEQQGHKVGYAPYSDLGFVSYWNTPFVLDDTLKSKQDLLVAWLRASARGWSDALKNPDATARLVVEKYGEGLDLSNQMIEMKRELPFIQTDFTKQKGLFWMERSVWQQAHDALLNRTKELEKPVSLDDVMTLDILQKVGKIG